jgi:hypothetical protein
LNCPGRLPLLEKYHKLPLGEEVDADFIRYEDTDSSSSTVYRCFEGYGFRKK